MIVFVCVLGLLVGLHLSTAALAAWRYLRQAPLRATEQPFMTLLRPVCGLDRFDSETLESSFHLTYPHYEILFCAAVADDPAVAEVKRLIAKYPDANARLLIGEDRITGNPKLNNLAKGWAQSRGEWVAMADANLLLMPNYFEQILHVVRPSTGLVTSPPIGIRADGLWGNVEAAFLNSFQGRWQLAADQLGRGFAQGKTLCWRRDVLENAGGLVALGRDLAEDVASTKAVRAQGLNVQLTRRAFCQPIGQRGFRAVWDRQLRWSRVRRDGFLGLFMLEIMLGPWVPALCLIVSGLGLWLPLFFAIWYGIEIALSRVAGWPYTIAAMILRDILMPALWVVTWARRGFEWRGSAMDAGGVLQTPKTAK
ncbi:ceramide glucosyltransferase [Thioclava sp. SK-1]|uniref:glycosyltransferase n=1 Tax=Thioclava sp. SK-1 TaxID=1889770 RepID=UPI0008255B4A|nr:glycosyltransferase [Thioclava sp. SK-1]OCX66810.1 ceramide glucosyltransferase [Thioclava sp. SK-1]